MKKIVCLKNETKETPLNAFKKTDTYKSMSSEFKSQLNSLMKYEYESDTDAKNGLNKLKQCFESQQETNLKIKTEISKNDGYIINITDTRHSKTLPNTYIGALEFSMSNIDTRLDKISLSIESGFILILWALHIFSLCRHITHDLGYRILYTALAGLFIWVIYCICRNKAAQIKKIYSFKMYFIIGSGILLFISCVIKYACNLDKLSIVIDIINAIITPIISQLIAQLTKKYSFI